MERLPTMADRSNWTEKEIKATDIFIEKMRIKYGDRFTYDKTKYIHSRTEVIITCLKHGDFTRQPVNLLKNYTCPACGKENFKKATTLTTEQYIERARKKHGDLYIYDVSIYTGAFDPINIRCKIHGIFTQRASHHLDGRGCQKCGGNAVPTQEEVIARFRAYHGDSYKYYKVDYKNDYTRVIVTCELHGDFLVTPGAHYKGGYCYECKVMILTDQFITEAHKIHRDQWDYSFVRYENCKKHIYIRCPKHGIFRQTPSAHISGQGCYNCGQGIKSNEEFITQSRTCHEIVYGYTKVQYKNNREKVIITCIDGGHGDFLQSPASHLRGAGCPYCLNKTEGILKKWLEDKYIIVPQATFDWCKNIFHLPFDFCIEKYKLLIELDGRQHFEQVLNWDSPEEVAERDRYKEKCALENGYSIIRMLQEDVYYNREDWKSKLEQNIKQYTKPTILLFSPKYDELDIEHNFEKLIIK